MGDFVKAWLSPAFIVTVLIIAGCIFAGIKRGFVKTTFDLFGMVVGVILTVLISPTVANLMRSNSGIYDSIHSKIAEHVNLNFNLSDNKLTDYIDNMTLPDKVGDFLLEGGKTAGNAAQGTLEKVNENIADKMTDVVINCIAFILTLVIVLVLLTIASILLDLVSKLPVLNGVNKFLGVVVGIVEAYVLLSVIGVVIMAISTSKIGITLTEQISANPILSFIYQNNLILIGIARFRGRV